MSIKVLGVALSLTAAFGLMACDNSSSSNKTPSCSVTSDANSVTMTSGYAGQSLIEKAVIEGDYIIKTSTYKGITSDDFEEECQDMKSYNRALDVTCEGRVITVKGSARGVTIDYLKQLAEEECADIKSADYDDDEDFDEEDF